MYKGEYVDDKKEGYGTHRWADGRMYEGYWKKDKREGKGVFVGVEGKTKYGVWSNDKRVKWITKESFEDLNEILE